MKKICFLYIAFLSANLFGQTVNIIGQNGSQTTIALDSITKIDFATDRTYALRIQQNDGSEIETRLTDIAQIAFDDVATSVDSKSQFAEAPQAFQLKQNYPNPFNPSTTIELVLPENGFLKIEILNVNGQLVRTLAGSDFPPGAHRVLWDGKNEKNQRVTSGVFYYRVSFKSSVQVKKLLLLK